MLDAFKQETAHIVHPTYILYFICVPKGKMMRELDAKKRLDRLEAKFRALPARQGARYNPLWGLCKAAIDAGYNTYDTLKFYVDGVFMSQWQATEPYIDGTVRHALEDTDCGKVETVKIERSKAIASVREKYSEPTEEFTKWIKERILTHDVFPTTELDEDRLDEMSADAMRRIVGDIPDDAYLYVGTGRYDMKGVQGKDKDKIGMWNNLDIPNDDTHFSWCPNLLKLPTRSKDSCREIKYLVMEMDRILDRPPEELDCYQRADYIYETAQKYWQYILSRKCLSIRALVNSGGKSIHALIPVTCTPEEFEQKKARLKACYLKMYMDDSMVDCVKKTRRPWGIRKYYIADNGGHDALADASAVAELRRKASKGDKEAESKLASLKLDENKTRFIIQEVLLLDEKAEPMTLDSFMDGMRQIYSEYIQEQVDEVTDAERKATEPMPLVWQETEDEAGETTGKWVWAGRNIDEFLKNVGISQYEKTDRALGLLKRDYNTHIVSDIDHKKAWSIIYEYVKARNVSMASELRDAYSKRFADSTLSIYVGNKIEKIRKLMGRKGETYFPYRNGLLVVRPDSVELKPYTHETYYGEIWDDAPTLQRDWKDSDGKASEMETFLRHMCGSELPDKALASKRYDATRAILGYEICACHEYTNWAVFLTDESLLNDDGGTGKSIAMKSIRYMRSMWIRDNATSKNKSEFDWSHVTRSIYNVGIDETDKDFDFREFFSKTTNSWNINHKFVDGTDVIPEMETPLLMFCTNNIPKGMEKSHERRKKIYEVSMHYHNVTPMEEFGHILYSDWDEAEWTRFDNFMIECCKFYMLNGLQEPEKSNVNMEAKQMMRNIPDEVSDWFEQEYITRDNEFKKLPSPEICKKYKIWCDENGRKNRDYSTRTLNDYVAKYCLAKGINDEFKKYVIKDWNAGREVERRVICHCFVFPKGAEDSSPKETGRTAHDALMPEACESPDYNPDALRKLGVESPF